MDDLISRKALIERLESHIYWGDSVIGLLEVAKNAPTIDAVEVVRCKDCVGSSLWNDKLICERISNVMDGYYHGTVEVVNPDDFCSRGIRKKATPCDAKMDAKEDDHG